VTSITYGRYCRGLDGWPRPWMGKSISITIRICRAVFRAAGHALMSAPGWCVLLCSSIVAAATAFAASPQPIVTVTVSGSNNPSIVGTAWPFSGPTFQLTFTTMQSPSVASVEGGVAFDVPVRMTYSSGAYTETFAPCGPPITGCAFINPPNSYAAWYDNPCCGTGFEAIFDAADGSILEVIVPLANPPPYTGTINNPALTLMTATGVTVYSYYYPSPTSGYSGASTSSGTYSALTAAIKLELGTSNTQPNVEMLALVTATDSNGNFIDMHDTAQQLGFDHFNWLQLIVSDLQLSACSTNPALSGCAGDATLDGTVPAKTFDPPPGGWAYQYWATYCPNSPCPFAAPIRDNWPMYYDEYFGTNDLNGPYSPSPSSPEYLWSYVTANSLTGVGTLSPLNPSNAFGSLFQDTPDTSGAVVPGSQPSQRESIEFVDGLVGVTGQCSTLSATANCDFQVIPGTTYRWWANNGGVSFRSQNLLPSVVNPVDLTGSQLANSIISLNQFLTLANLTPSQLVAMGGGVAGATASLIPSEAAALAAALNPCNGQINVAVVQLEINEALGAMASMNDLNADGVVNVVDIQIEINAALGLGCASQ
jgi:hypothetical protein